MRALLSLSSAVVLATISAGCPYQESLSRAKNSLSSRSGAVEANKPALASPAATPVLALAEPVKDPLVDARDSAPESDADALDPKSASAWGIPAWPADPAAPLDSKTDDSADATDTGAPELRDGDSAANDSMAWANGVIDDATERFFGDHGAVLVSIAKETWVYDKPRWRSHRIGYLRAGSKVGRSDEAIGYSSCKGGWYAIEPRGYVCVGPGATTDPNNPIATLSKTRPKMDRLPYAYAISRIPGPPMYTRVPTVEEQRKVETDLGYHLRQTKALAHDPAFVALPDAEPTPDGLTGQTALPALADETPRSFSDLLVGRAKPRAGFALLSQFDVEGRRFGLTTQLFVVPLDRTRFISGSVFHGIELKGGVTLPVAFVMKHHATHFDGSESGPRHAGASLEFREAVPLTGRDSADGQYYEAKDGSWVKAEDVRRVDPMHRAPAWAVPGRKWVDVSILKQVLIAYEGTTPVYVTLVSTGADGLGDPKKTHSTIQGTFLIHTKHVTVTMDNEEKNDEFDLRDVPFVQYFTEGYALHAAYWHDDFGTPRSHGCVNLAPIDAAWLFGFTTPDVPKGWHAAMSLKKGTLVHTHP